MPSVSADALACLCSDVLDTLIVVFLIVMPFDQLFFFFKQKTAYEIMPSLVGSQICIRDRHLQPGEVYVFLTRLTPSIFKLPYNWFLSVYTHIRNRYAISFVIQSYNCPSLAIGTIEARASFQLNARSLYPGFGIHFSSPPNF